MSTNDSSLTSATGQPLPTSPEGEDGGLEPEIDRGPEIEVPFDPSKIDIIVKSMTISNLLDRLRNDELDLTPDFQRQANLWDEKRKSRLIESILLRIPLPSFYFSEDDSGVYAVVDGLQRLCAVFHYSNYADLNRATGARLNSLRLVGLQYLGELEGCSYDELDRKFQRRVNELELTTNIIRASTPTAVKFNVFARLNQGGVPLVAQEIRNAIFPGDWRNQVRAMASSSEFLDVTGGRVRTTRQQDAELVLRFVALWQLGHPYSRPANKSLDEFLNDVVETTLMSWSASRWNRTREVFSRALMAAREIFQMHAFRRSSGTRGLAPINRGLFEAQLVALAHLDESELRNAIKYRERVAEAFARAIQSDWAFIGALSSGTGSPEASNTRVSTMMRILKGAALD